MYVAYVLDARTVLYIHLPDDRGIPSTIFIASFYFDLERLIEVAFQKYLSDEI